jgi:hypothetical protein
MEGLTWTKTVQTAQSVDLSFGCFFLKYWAWPILERNSNENVKIKAIFIYYDLINLLLLLDMLCYIKLNSNLIILNYKEKKMNI